MRRQGSAAEDENNAAGKRTEGGSNQEGANMTIGFIGLGNMARAVIGGMLDKGIVKPEDICGSAKTEATRKKMEDSCKIRTASCNREVAEQAEILVLAVKPQFFEEVIEEIKGISWEGKTIISLAPGKTIAWLQEKIRAEASGGQMHAQYACAGRGRLYGRLRLTGGRFKGPGYGAGDSRKLRKGGGGF